MINVHLPPQRVGPYRPGRLPVPDPQLVTDDALEAALRPSLAAQSVEACRSAFPRWRAFLVGQGVDRMPSALSTAPADAKAVNLLCLLVRQHSDHHDAAIEHNLRNVAGVRTYKP